MKTTSLDKQVIEQADSVRVWMFEQAFPFWAEATVNPEGGFFERHDVDGQGILGEDSRVRLQARQTYCFALAADIGWNSEASRILVDRGLDVLIEDCRRPDGLYGTRVQPGTGLTNSSAETYDCAFALLAFATAWRVFRIDRARDAGFALRMAITQHLKNDARGGYRERLPAPSIREQNPHMHLCETFLAWYEASGEQQSLQDAVDVAKFVQDKFWDCDKQILLEFGPTANNNHVEIGHLYEWVWILHRLCKLSGQPLMPFAHDLYAAALKWEARQSYLPLASHVDGSVKISKQRTWGLTEALKAHITHSHEVERSVSLARIHKATEALFNDHLRSAVSGGWHDEISPDGMPVADWMTPATGYHIFLAFAEHLEFAQKLTTPNTSHISTIGR